MAGHVMLVLILGLLRLLTGAEDVALIEYAHLTGRPYRVFSLDTGRLNPETYRCQCHLCMIAPSW